jgi:FMN phosphatase YigB (HAD superfamily)
MINKNKVILTDCDGVCLDWEFGFHTWMDTHKHKLVNKDFYSVAKQYDMHPDDTKYLVEQFNSSASIGFLPPLRDAQYYIKLLAEKLGYRFVAVTSLSHDESAQKLRTCNLKKLFGNDTFIEYHYLGCGDDKDEILLELANKYEGSIWVEDKYVNAEVGASVGFDALLVEHGHNLNKEGNFKVVRNWEEIYKYVERKETERDLKRRTSKFKKNI